MSERKAYEALSSESRLKILKELQKEALGVEGIAKLVNLQPITVRHHLQLLEDAGLVESHEERTGSVGRPKVLYKISEKPTLVSYPKRGYLTLSSFIVRSLQGMIGSRKAGKLLKAIGRNMGESAVREIELNQGVGEWSPEAFLSFFVKGYEGAAGAEPEVVKVNENNVTYRVHNCLFLELAVRMPDMMCDILHEAFHEGVANAMGGKVKIMRLSCKGHGAPFCEHKCTWQSDSK